jgi:hypothetical protein
MCGDDLHIVKTQVRSQRARRTDFVTRTPRYPASRIHILQANTNTPYRRTRYRNIAVTIEASDWQVVLNLVAAFKAHPDFPVATPSYHRPTSTSTITTRLYRAMDIDDLLAEVAVDSTPQGTRDLQELTRCWVAERVAPEILPWPSDLMDRVLERIRKQVRLSLRP